MVKYFQDRNQRVAVQKHSGDFEVFSQSNSSGLDLVSVPIVGTWTDNQLGEITSGGQQTRQLMMRPNPNKFFGTDAGLLGAREPNLNDIGQNSDTFRRRKFILNGES